jgi:hypothetical protein
MARCDLWTLAFDARMSAEYVSVLQHRTEFLVARQHRTETGAS